MRTNFCQERFPARSLVRPLFVPLSKIYAKLCKVGLPTPPVERENARPRFVVVNSSPSTFIALSLIAERKRGGGKMTFWQENYSFIKDVYDSRSTKLIELMDKTDKAIGAVLADKIYTSNEFKKIKESFMVRKERVVETFFLFSLEKRRSVWG